MQNIKNKIQLIGHLGAKPEIKEFESGRKLAKVNIATNERYTNAKGEKVENTQWHRLVAWGKTAEIFEKYTDKGSEIAVDGKLVYNQFTTKEGDKREVAEVEVSEILLLSKKEQK